MISKISGNGNGETGSFVESSGVPLKPYLWRLSPDDGVVGRLPPYNFLPLDAERVCYISSVAGLSSLNVVELQTGAINDLFQWPRHNGPSCQLCLSSDKILAGTVMIDASSLDVIGEYPEFGSKNSIRSGNQVGAPVVGGFLYLCGSRRKTYTLLHVRADTKKLRPLVEGITAFVMMPYSEHCFAVRSNQLICMHWASGEIMWERDHGEDLRWHEDIDNEVKIEPNDGSRIDLMWENDYLYLYRRAAYLNQYNALTGELISSIDTTVSNPFRGEGSDLRRYSDQNIIASGVYYAQNGPVIRAISVDTQSLVFEHNNNEFGVVMFVAGDLIFTNVETSKRIRAYDRFTGEMCWDVDCPINDLSFGFPWRNKIIFYSVRGAITCFEWESPYESPARI